MRIDMRAYIRFCPCPGVKMRKCRLCSNESMVKWYKKKTHWASIESALQEPWERCVVSWHIQKTADAWKNKPWAAWNLFKLAKRARTFDHFNCRLWRHVCVCVAQMCPPTARIPCVRVSVCDSSLSTSKTHTHPDFPQCHLTQATKCGTYTVSLVLKYIFENYLCLAGFKHSWCIAIVN